MKQILQIGNKLRIDRNEDSALGTFPAQIETLYNSNKTVKEIHYDVYKKMSTVSVTNYVSVDDKKNKKNGFELLSNTLSEAEKRVSDDMILRETFIHSVKVLDELAKASKEFDRKLSLNVIKYFQDLHEDSSLNNLKKSLASINRELKFREEKLQNIQEQIHSQSNDIRRNIGDASSTSDKLMAALQAEENSEKELEIKQDLFLTKLFTQNAQKVNINEKILEFFQTYQEYFSNCQEILQEYIPVITNVIEKSKQNFVFNLPLEEQTDSNGGLSFVLEMCIDQLDREDTLCQEGLFRVSGSKGKIDLLKSALNVKYYKEHILKGCDSAVFASLLKQYLRELPEPLMTSDLYEKWCEASNSFRQNSDIEVTRTIVKQCLEKMPKLYYDNLVYLMQFLRKIADHESQNKMTPSNLSLMFGPNLIRPKITDVPSSEESDSTSRNYILASGTGSSVVEYMIIDFHELFKGAPVYKTKPSITANSVITIPEEAVSEQRKMPDNESVISSDSILDDGSGLNNSDNTIKKLKGLRKPPAPPPPCPPPNKSYISSPTGDSSDSVCTNSNINSSAVDLVAENEDRITDIGSETSVTETKPKQPTIKKRFSKLDANSSPLNRAVSVNISPRQLFGSPPPPTQHSKKSPINEGASKPLRPAKSILSDMSPPKRPSNPPPPVPFIDKTKDITSSSSSSSNTGGIQVTGSSDDTALPTNATVVTEDNSVVKRNVGSHGTVPVAPARRSLHYYSKSDASSNLRD